MLPNIFHKYLSSLVKDVISFFSQLLLPLPLSEGSYYLSFWSLELASLYLPAFYFIGCSYIFFFSLAALFIIFKIKANFMIKTCRLQHINCRFCIPKQLFHLAQSF